MSPDLLLSPVPPLREVDPWTVEVGQRHATEDDVRRLCVTLAENVGRQVDAWAAHEMRRYLHGGPAYVWPTQEPVVTERAWCVT